MEGLFKFLLEENGALFQGKITLGIDKMSLDLLVVSIDEVEDESKNEGIVGTSIDFMLNFSIFVLDFLLVGANHIIGSLLICCICHYIRLFLILILSHFKSNHKFRCMEG